MKRALLHTYAEITHIDMYSYGEMLDFFRTTQTHIHTMMSLLNLERLESSAVHN